MDSHVRQCPDNLSNITYDQLPKSLDSHIDVVKCSVGVTAFLFVLPFVLFYFKRFPIGATGAVLVGATLTVLTQTIDQHEVYQVLGAPENTRTICLLLGMMILAQYFERELLAEKVLSKILTENSTFAMYLLAVTSFDFVLSAILTNDVACVALTPIILQHWNRRKGPKSRSQLSVLLLGIATSANIGSSSTIFGNPQMALIASKTSQPLFDKSRLDMRRCIFYLWLPAILCFGVNYFFLLIYAWMLERVDGFRRKRKQGGNISTIKGSGHVMESVTGPAPIASYPVHQEDNQQSVNHHTDQGSIRHNVPVVRSMSSASSAIASHFGDRDQDNWTPSNSKVFQAILCSGLILIVVLFLVSNEQIHFDMGLVPMGIAIVAMLADSLLNTRPPLTVLKRVDWSVLIMFFGMFIWLYGLNRTNAPRYIWDRLHVAQIMKPDRTIFSYLIFYAFILICSNIFSNVPLTIIVLELLIPCVNQLELVLYLAWIATLAGNLTLFGSVANLIVAQKALTTMGYHLGFFEYLRYGFVTTLVLSVLGMAVIYGLLQV